nr:FAD-binding protein [Thermanaeromonas toyohensis]
MGGGLAGLMAARFAALEKAKVVVLDKARAATSGPSAFAAGDILCWLPGEEPLEEWIEAYFQVGAGLNSREWLASLLDTNYRLILELDRQGFPFEKENGKFLRRSGRGPLVKCVLAPMYKFQEFSRELCLKLGVTFLDRVAVTKIIFSGGQPNGLIGFHVRTGDFIAIQAKAIILATGGCSFRGPFFGQNVVAGEGLRLGLEAGAKLAYMEYGNHYNVSLAAFNTYGQSKFMAHGGKYLNSLGQELPLKGASGNTIVKALVEEVKAGRGPIYMDLTGFRERELIEKLMPNLARLIARSGIDFYGIKHEVWPAFTGTSNAAAAGIWIDRKGMSTVPGLFAAGDTAAKGLVVGGCIGLSGISLAWALYTGFLAGKNAARYAKETPPLRISEEPSLEEEQNTIFTPLRHKEKQFIARDLLIKTSQLMSRVDISLIRSEERILTALKQIKESQQKLIESAARDPHELMIWYETLSTLTVAEAILLSALHRKETRGDFYREDYPEANPELESVLGVGKSGDSLVVTKLGKPEEGYR